MGSGHKFDQISVSLRSFELEFCEGFGFFLCGSNKEKAGHTCGLTASGLAYCWGAGDVGQLGHGLHHPTLQDEPVEVSGRHTFSTISAAGSHTCALVISGEVYCWGRRGEFGKVVYNVPELVSREPKLATISGRCGLTIDGKAYCQDVNYSFLQFTYSPVDTDLAFTSISARSGHAWGIAEDGAAYCWGSNDRGQLGNGPHSSS